MVTQQPPTDLAVYMKDPQNLAQFEDLLGKDAQSYVQSVLIAVYASEDLMKCTPNSIQHAALRAASLGLSCDPALKQAWIIAYNRNLAKRNETPRWVKEAQFQPHYKGLHTLAMRTNKYYIINVGPVYDGQRVLENQLTGLHVVIQPDGLATEPEVYSRAYAIPSQYAEWRDVTVRRDHDQKTSGWLAYFETRQGFKKSVYMSCDEIEQFARIHVKDYMDEQGKIKNPNWRDPNKRPIMEMKTVFRQLMNWADLSGKENRLLAEALKADATPETIDAESADWTPADALDLVESAMSYDDAKQVIVKGKKGEKFLGQLSAEQLQYVIENDKDESHIEAAKVVLEHDFNMTQE